MPGGWPLFRRAPGRLMRSGSTALMIIVSVTLLAGLVAAGPLFGATTDAGGLARRLASIPETASPTLRPVVRVGAFGRLPAETKEQLQKMVDGVPFTGTPVTGVFADSWQLDQLHPVPYIEANGRRVPAVLFSRTGAIQALKVVRGTPGAEGVWLPEGAARDLGVKPGDRFTVGKTYYQVIPACGSPLQDQEPIAKATDARTGLRVAGTYATGPDGRLPTGSYFSHLGTDLPSDPGHCPTAALMVVGDLPVIQGALDKLDELPVWSHTSTLLPAGRTPANLATAAAAAAKLRLAASAPGTPVNELVSDNGAISTRIDTGLPEIHAQAVKDAAAAAAQGRGIAYAGAVLGLAAVVLALTALAQRRRRETEMLIGLGTPTRIVVATGALELAVPTVIGAALGWAVASVTFGVFGPQPSLAGSALRSAGIAAGLVVLVVLAADAVVTSGQARQVSRALAGAAPSRLGNQWLPLLTGATVLGVISTLARGTGDSFRDPLAALLPILVLACGCSLIVRGAAFVLERVRRPARAEVAVAPDRLVLRGLSRTGVAVADLVIVLSIGVGVLAYGVLSAGQVRESVTDKAAVLAGAESTAHIAHSWSLGFGGGASPKLPSGSSIVWRATGVISPGGVVYDVMAVDPDTLGRVADWGAGPDLARARSALASLGVPATEPGDTAQETARRPLPALVVGPLDRAAGTTAEIKVGFTTAPLVVRERLTAFPGAVRPTVVVDARSWFPRLPVTEDPSRFVRENLGYEGSFATWVWSRSSLPVLSRLLDDHAVVPSATLTLDQSRATPELTSARWASAYQVVLGLAAAALSGLALVVAVDRRVARAAPVDLVLRRFGFRPARLLRLRARELALTCVAALAVAALPFLLMATLLPRLAEPLTSVPPSLPVHVSALPVLLSVGVAVVVTLLATLAAARRSAALRPGEVLRDDN